MPKRDGTGPRGNGPKRVNQGTPTPRRDGSGRGQGINRTTTPPRRSGNKGRRQ